MTTAATTSLFGQSPEGYRQTRYSAPPGATTILLVRHGASEPAHPDRPFPLKDGHGDPALDPSGIRQAVQVGGRLSRERIDAIFVTSLRRTHQTAAPLAQALALTPIEVPSLREVHLGEWEGGLIRARAAALDPIWVRARAEQRWDIIPGAESAEALTERIRAGINRIVAAHPDGRVAAFVHGGIVSHTLHLASGASRFGFAGAENGSISELVVLGDEWIVRRFNDTSHLD